MVSPSYLASSYCGLERRAFRDAVLAAPEPHKGERVDNSLRILKVVKTPLEGNRQRQFVPDALGFEFFRSIDERDFDEFTPGEREFDDEIDRLARRVADLLRRMRNRSQAIYVAEPPGGLQPVWEGVRNELAVRGYRVVPSFRLDEFFAPEAISAEMDPSILTVHLFGGSFDEFAVLQANLARQLNKHAVLWVQPETQLDERQRAFLATHAGFANSTSRYVYLTSQQGWQLPSAILDELKPRRDPLSSSNGNGAPSIYLICDRTDPEESGLAAQLRQSIMDREGMQVYLPAVDKDPAVLDEEHWNRLAACDGVLVYWGQTSKDWFTENLNDVTRATRRLRAAKPFRSQAVLLGQPDQPDKATVDYRLVIRNYSQPAMEPLEPFLAPLRQAASAAGKGN